MKPTFAILGAGMQGTATAYDLVRFGDPAAIRFGDVSLAQAQHATERVNLLTGSAACEAQQVDALNPDSLRKFLEGVDVLCSCVPYWMHPKIAKVAIECGVNMCDLGGNTEITMETLHLNADAEAKGVTLVPDTGLAPGLVNSLGLYLIESMDSAESIKLYCGVLPQNPVPPFNYKVTFNVEGLVTEYDYQAVTLRNGEIHLVDTLTETEELHINELGTMEAFVTSGGTSTAPYTLKGRVENYEYKTIRFPGHGMLMKVFKDFGFWNEESVEIDGNKVIPKNAWIKIFGEQLSKFVDKDMCAIRAVGVGMKDGQPVRKQVDIFDRQCDKTGFTSMERLTGFSMSIYAIEIANGRTPKGCVRYEQAVTGTTFVNELKRRDFNISEA